MQRIVAAFDPRPEQVIVEIGPGLGALTYALLSRTRRLHVLELDRDLAQRLRERRQEAPQDELNVHQVDALEFDFCGLATTTKLRLIGNLPYNISTPLLFRLLDQARCIQDMLFMLQKEVVERMSAPPGGKDYGRLSVMIQACCAVQPLFTVGPGAFTPPPKVDSAVVRLSPYVTPPVEVADRAAFALVVRTAFAQRRKTLRNSLKKLIAAEELVRLGIDPGRRAETLSLQEFGRLSTALSRTQKGDPV